MGRSSPQLVDANGNPVSQECDSCGGEVPIKINKNGRLFYKCRHIVNPKTGVFCGHEVKYSPEYSKKIINEVQGGKDETGQVTGEEEQSREGAGNQGSVRREQPRGDGATTNEFLTF